MWFLARENSVTRVVGYSTCLQVQLSRAKNFIFFSEIFRKNYFLEFYESDENFKKCKKIAKKFCTVKSFFIQFDFQYQKCEILLFQKVLKKIQFLVDEFQRNALLHPFRSKYFFDWNFTKIARSWPLLQYIFSFQDSFFSYRKWLLKIVGPRRTKFA